MRLEMRGEPQLLQQTETPAILIVDDEPIIRDLCARALKDYRILQAENGQEAVEKAASEHFDLILMDIQMPVMNGYEATRALREQQVTTPIIAVTAYAMKGDCEKWLEAGCDDYLSKPIERRELLKKLRKYLFSLQEANC